MKKNIIKFTLFLLVVVIFFPLAMNAAAIFDDGGVIASDSTLPTEGTSPVARIILIIQVSLSFLGAITTIVLVYAGFLFAFSGGNPSTVDKARKTLTWALIGMLVVLASWAMTTFVRGNFNVDLSDTSNQPTGYCLCDGVEKGTLTQISCSAKCKELGAMSVEWKKLD